MTQRLITTQIDISNEMHLFFAIDKEDFYFRMNAEDWKAERYAKYRLYIFCTDENGIVVEEQNILFEDLTKANTALSNYMTSMNPIVGMKVLEDFGDNNGDVWVRKIFEKMEENYDD